MLSLIIHENNERKKKILLSSAAMIGVLSIKQFNKIGMLLIRFFRNTIITHLYEGLDGVYQIVIFGIILNVVWLKNYDLVNFWHV